MALAGLVLAWFDGRAGFAVILALSVVTALYFAFRLPVPCGAMTREEAGCRKNAYGILMGCEIRQHRWQKLKMKVVPHSFRQLRLQLFNNPKDGLGTLVAVASILSTVIAGVALVLKK